MTIRDGVHGFLIAVLGAAFCLIQSAKAQSYNPPPLTYNAISDRLPRPQAVIPPALGPAGSTFVDPDFGTRILRVTGPTSTEFANSSYTTMANGQNLEGNADSTRFVVGLLNGYMAMYKFDPSTFSATLMRDPANPSQTYWVQNFAAWSFSDPNIYYGSGPTGHTAYKYDVRTKTGSLIIDWDQVIPTEGLPNPYFGGAPSADQSGNIFLTAIGGHQQSHPFLCVFNRLTGQTAVLDLKNSQVRSFGSAGFVPTDYTLGYGIHSAFIDRSGKQVVFTGGDILNSDKHNANPYVQAVWNLNTNHIAEIDLGHSAFGFEKAVYNGGTQNYGHDVSWYRRSLADPTEQPTELGLPEVADPQRWETDGHPSWHNAVEGLNVPFIMEQFLNPVNNFWFPPRAYDNEIIGIATDGSNQVWRFAHTYSGIYGNFYDQPRANVSQNGRYALFTSNWLKTLGKDTNGSYRYDVFLVELDKTSAPTPVIDQTPPTKPAFLHVQQNQCVTGTVDFTAVASDNVGVEGMLYRKGTGLTEPPITPPFTHIVDTTAMPDGQYNWVAIAYDAQKNATQSDLLTFYVGNHDPHCQPPAVAVGLTPAFLRMHPGETTQFTASVSGSTNSTVKWSLSPPLGTITSSGLYQAPAAPFGAVVSPQNVAIRATSVADPTKYAQATVALIPRIVISISPTTATLFPNGTQVFQVVVSGGVSQTGVKWSMTPSVGTLDNGTYTAPAGISSQQTITVTATSVADSSISAYAVVTVMPKVYISITPAQAHLFCNQRTRFAASVTGNPNTGVIWSRAPERGTLLPDGSYSAPSDLNLVGHVTITATSLADPHISASADIMIDPPPSIRISPVAIAMAPGTAQQFTAAVSGGVSNAVEWTVFPARGTITSEGVYTAPSNVSTPEIVTIRAVSLAYPAVNSATFVSVSPVANHGQPGASP